MSRRRWVVGRSSSSGPLPSSQRCLAVVGVGTKAVSVHVGAVGRRGAVGVRAQAWACAAVAVGVAAGVVGRALPSLSPLWFWSSAALPLA